MQQISAWRVGCWQQPARRRNWLQCVGCLLLFFISVADSDAQLVVTDPERVYRADPSVSWWVAGAAQLSIEEVSQLAAADFQRSRGAVQFGYRGGPVWIRLELNSQLLRDQALALHVRYPPLDRIDLYFDVAGEWVKQTAGDHYLLGRAAAMRQPVFDIPFVAGQSRVVYLRIESTSSLSIPIFVGSQAAMRAWLSVQEWGNGIYYGVACAMLIYNLLLFWLVRERIYLEYVGCVIFQVSALAAMSGYVTTLIPAWPVLNARLTYLLPMALAVVFLLFSRSLLNTRVDYPQLDRLYRYLMGLPVLAYLLLLVAPSGITHSLIHAVILGVIIAVFPLAVRRWWSGYRPARYFVFGQGALLLPIMFMSLSSMNLVPGFEWSPLLVRSGGAVELMLFSMCLAERITDLKRSHDASRLAEQAAQAEKQASQRHLRATHELNQQLQHALHARSQFLANISHEIRTPMNGILGMLELLDGANLSASEAQSLSVARRSGDTLMKLINEVLDLAKIEAGQLQLDRAQFDLRALLLDLKCLYAPQASAKQLEFSVVIAPEVAANYWEDRLRLWQILTNLVSNAVKFTQDGGITIRASHASSGDLQLQVEDTGIGIDRAHHARIFDSFQQADGSVTRQFGGSGLGLSISWQLAQVMGGSLSLESVPRVGSTFTLRLPRHPLPITMPPAANVEAGSELRLDALDVLLVEDNPVNQQVAQGMLRRLGVTAVTMVDNGMDALAACADQAFDVILLDIQMPLLDGLAVAKRVRTEEGPNQHTPLIAMTANAMESDRRASLAAGINVYLTKPISLVQVYNALTTVTTATATTTAITDVATSVETSVETKVND